jgi:C-terminal processing protease CtpA/Prc
VGTLFSDISKDHKALTFVASLVALIGSYYLMRDIYSDLVTDLRYEIQSHRIIEEPSRHASSTPRDEVSQLATKSALGPAGRMNRQAAIDLLGITVRSPNERTNCPSSITMGLLVVDVIDDSPAAGKLKAGDIVCEVDRELVDEPNKLIAKIIQARNSGHTKVLLLIGRSNGLHFDVVIFRR